MRGTKARTAWALAGGTAALTLLATTGAHAEGEGDIRVVKTVVNHGHNVVVGTSKRVTFPIDMTVKDDHGVKKLGHVSTFNWSNGYGFFEWVGSTCVKKSSTTAVCTATMQADPSWIPHSDDIDTNKVAGVWGVNATVDAKDGDYWISDGIAMYKVRRASMLTADASPEPVTKGAKLTVRGKLSRANWEDLKYHGFTQQLVKLQFKASGSAHYQTVKTVKTDSAGKLGTTVTATSSGTWRWYFPGTTTTDAAVSPGDAVTLSSGASPALRRGMGPCRCPGNSSS